MNGDPMEPKGRRHFGGGNGGKWYDCLSSCAPNLQVISAVSDLIGDAEETSLLQEINPKPDENAKRNYMYDRLVEHASVNDGWRGHSRNQCRRAQPKPAFVQDGIFEGDYLHRLSPECVREH